MDFEILIGGKAFMADLEEKAKIAKNRLFVQVMTFEGDLAGEQLIEAMISSLAREKVLVIDSFSKVVVSDDFVWSTRYLKDAAFRKEIRNTRQLLHRAQAVGIKVKWVNPTSPMMIRYPLRNHKKIVIADDFSYLGGINFSDHNFSWYDMMVCIKSDELSTLLSADIMKTIAGSNQSDLYTLPFGQLALLNGRNSQAEYAQIFEWIAQAKNQITVISPYISGPWIRTLIAARKSGVTVKLITAAANNKSLFGQYLEKMAQKYDFELYKKSGMLHMKAMLIDRDRLIFGSSNFDVISYYFEQEVLLSVTRKDWIVQFHDQVIGPLLEDCKHVSGKAVFSESSINMLKYLEVFSNLASKTLLKPKGDKFAD